MFLILMVNIHVIISILEHACPPSGAQTEAAGKPFSEYQYLIFPTKQVDSLAGLHYFPAVASLHLASPGNLTGYFSCTTSSCISTNTKRH